MTRNHRRIEPGFAPLVLNRTVRSIVLYCLLTTNLRELSLLRTRMIRPYGMQNDVTLHRLLVLLRQLKRAALLHWLLIHIKQARNRHMIPL